MKLYTANLKYTNGSTYKFNSVATLIRNKAINNAIEILTFSKRSPAKIILKLLNSCVANAVNLGAATEKMAIVNVDIGKGFTLKRITPRGRGRMSRIEKRYSKVTISIGEKNPLENKKGVNKKSYGTKN